MLLLVGKKDGLPPAALLRSCSEVLHRFSVNGMAGISFSGSESDASPVLLIWVQGECGEGGSKQKEDKKGEEGCFHLGL